MIDCKLFIEKEAVLSIRKQCALLDITRSALYYQAKGESKSNIQMMEIMDKHILQEPTAGVLTMQSVLEEKGIIVGYEWIRRLMRLANITPIYPRRHLAIKEVNQVWEIDIT
jgi:putative transposase